MVVVENEVHFPPLIGIFLLAGSSTLSHVYFHHLLSGLPD